MTATELLPGIVVDWDELNQHKHWLYALDRKNLDPDGDDAREGLINLIEELEILYGPKEVSDD